MECVVLGWHSTTLSFPCVGCAPSCILHIVLSLIGCIGSSVPVCYLLPLYATHTSPVCTGPSHFSPLPLHPSLVSFTSRSECHSWWLLDMPNLGMVAPDSCYISFSEGCGESGPLSFLLPSQPSHPLCKQVCVPFTSRQLQHANLSFHKQWNRPPLGGCRCSRWGLCRFSLVVSLWQLTTGLTLRSCTCLWGVP